MRFRVMRKKVDVDNLKKYVYYNNAGFKDYARMTSSS